MSTKLTLSATRLGEKLEHFSGDAHLYLLSTPLEGHRFVIVSATVVPIFGPETYVFPADENGKITSWVELRGSYRGGLDHAEALRRAGYKVTEGNAK